MERAETEFAQKYKKAGSHLTASLCGLHRDSGLLGNPAQRLLADKGQRQEVIAPE